MPAAITTVDQLLQSARFKKATKNRIYTTEEKDNINTFLKIIAEKVINAIGSVETNSQLTILIRIIEYYTSCLKIINKGKHKVNKEDSLWT